MSASPLTVVAVSNDALRPELLDRLLVTDSNYNVIVVESIERGYSKIRQMRPDVVVLFINIDDLDACQLLSMLHMDRGLRGTTVVTCTTGPDTGAAHRVREFDEQYDARLPMAS